MKALTFQGKNHVSVENVPDPKIEHPRDAIIKVSESLGLKDKSRLVRFS